MVLPGHLVICLVRIEEQTLYDAALAEEIDGAVYSHPTHMIPLRIHRIIYLFHFEMGATPHYGIQDGHSFGSFTEMACLQKIPKTVLNVGGYLFQLRLILFHDTKLNKKFESDNDSERRK